MALQIVFCITIICIVALQLVKSTNAGVQCLFGNRDYSGDGLCVYSYVVAGSGIVAALTLSVLMVSC